MIYFIGGPPKCGKTTLAKKLSKKYKIPWVSSDTLQVVAAKYISKYAKNEIYKKLYPHNNLKGKNNDETYNLATPKKIAKNYIKQAKASEDAIDMFTICEITDGNDYIVEGYHVTPRLVYKLQKKYGKKNFKIIFLGKFDEKKFVKDVKKSSTPNDWILKKTKQEETFYKIANMITYYSGYFEKEAKKYKYTIYNMDKKFNEKIKQAMKYLID